MVWIRCGLRRAGGSIFVLAIGVFPLFQGRVCTAQAVSELSVPDSPGAMARRITDTVSEAGRPSSQAAVEGQQDAPEQLVAGKHPRPPRVDKNFYTSYMWAAGPLTTGEKYGLVAHSLADPMTYMTVAAVSGVEQAKNSYPGYGAGAQGYGKRYGADLAEKLSDRLLGDAVLASILRQDPRYFYKGTGSFVARLRYAMGSTLLRRGEGGRRQLNISGIGGSFMAAGLSNAYRADVDRNAKTTFIDAFVLVGERMGYDVLREFWPRPKTAVPGSANGKP